MKAAGLLDPVDDAYDEITTREHGEAGESGDEPLATADVLENPEESA